MNISQSVPGLSLDMVDQWAQARYSERILSAIPWKRTEGLFTLPSPPSVIQGLVSVNQGSAAITGSGTQWTAAQNGLYIRIGNFEEYYQFTYASATSGSLDRNYEQPSGSILTSLVGAGGVNYANGDQFAVVGGAYKAIGTITAVGVGGVVISYTFQQVGSAYAVASGVATTTTGAGSGFTLNILTVAASTGLAYRIDQAVYLLPTNARVVNGVYPLHDRARALEQITPGELNRRDPKRQRYGTPTCWALSWDNNGSPPSMQIELNPIPANPNTNGTLLSHTVDYVYDAAAIDPAATATSLLPWMSSGAMYNGIMADACRWRASLPKSNELFLPNGLQVAQEYGKEFDTYLATMGKINAQQRGSQPLRLADEYEGNGRAGYPYHGRWHRGFTG